MLAKWAAGSRGLGSCLLLGAMRKAGAGLHLRLWRSCRISDALTWTIEQDRAEGGGDFCSFFCSFVPTEILVAVPALSLDVH